MELSYLDRLPSEIVYYILSYLPIPSLLAFGATSHTNHAFHTYSLSTLHLAVFPKHVQAMIAFLQSTPTSLNPAFQVPVIIPRSKSHGTAQETPRNFRTHVIDQQNRILANLVRRYGIALRDLEFFAWELTDEAATALARSCASLRRLALCFDHPYARDSCIPSFFFDRPGPASTIWNALGGVGPASAKALAMRGLESLRLERTGVTEWQLRKFVEVNPRLRELKLRKCAGVDYEFVRWLGGSESGRRLEVLWIEDCEDIWALRQEHLGWVEGLKCLKVS